MFVSQYILQASFVLVIIFVFNRIHCYSFSDIYLISDIYDAYATLHGGLVKVIITLWACTMCNVSFCERIDHF